MTQALRVGCVLAAVFALAACSPVHLEREEPSPAEARAADESAEADEVQQLTGILAELVRRDPWRHNIRPLLYVEETPREDEQGRPVQPGPGPNLDDEEQDLDEDERQQAPSKRSRYYRRYPWKRVTRTRGSYDPDLYMCTPSKEDVIQLLVGLHRAREGDTGRTINFCNRKRPASAVFTNIRFIG